MEQDGPSMRTRSLTEVPKIYEDLECREVNSDSSINKNKTVKVKGAKKRLQHQQVKSRTPSGCEISNSVKDIRDFFAQQNSYSEVWKQSDWNPTVKNKRPQKYSQDRTKDTVQAYDPECTMRQSQSDTMGPADYKYKGRVKRKTTRVECFKELVNKGDKRKCVNKALTVEPLTAASVKVLMEKGETVNSNWDSLSLQMCEANNAKTIKAIKEKNANQLEDQSAGSEVQEYLSAQDGESETNPTEDSISRNSKKRTEPKVMDLQAVMAMFREIKEDMAEIKKNKCKERIDKLERQHHMKQRNIKEVQEEVQSNKVKNELLSGVVKRMAVEIQELKNKIEYMETDRMKNMVTVVGFDGSQDNGICKQQVEAFLFDEMGIDISIVELFQIGEPGAKGRTIVMTLESKAAKLEVYKNAHRIKNIRNVHGGKYKFRDYLPPAANEKDRRESEIIGANYRAKANQVEMKRNRKDGLQIKGKRYVKKVEVPSVETILDLSDGDMRNIMSTELDKSDELECEGSTFIGYTLPVENYEQVQNAYIKLKLLYPDARHIVCAYSLPGVDKYYCEDFCDDEEYNGGRTLLRLLLDSNISNRAVFVTHFYSGRKIGAKRYECLKSVVQQAVDKTATNPYTKKVQRIQPKPRPTIPVSQPFGKTGRGGAFRPCTYIEAIRGTRGRGRGHGMTTRIYDPPTKETNPLTLMEGS